MLSKAEQAQYDYQVKFHPQDNGRYPGEPDWQHMTDEQIEEAREKFGLNS